MTLEVAIDHRVSDAFRLTATFSSEVGLTALFGASGAGKTSLVNAMSGLLRPDSGRIAVGGATLVDTRAGVFVPPHRRRIGYVFQEGRLFPHLTVRRNLLFGRWFTRASDDAADQGEFDRIVEMLGVAHLLHRRPGGLSGGEKQRVAIGRALLSRPRMLLMDEPLASLDDARKSEILPYIERLRDEARIPIIYVSHSLVEVIRLARKVIVLAQGKVSAEVTPAELLGRADLAPDPNSDFGALLAAEIVEHDAAYGLATLSTRAGRLYAPWRDGFQIGGLTRVRIRARDVMLATRRPEQLSALNALDGVLVAIDGRPEEALADVRVDCAGETVVARLTRKAIENLALRPGMPVVAIIKTATFDGRALAGARAIGLEPLDL